MINIFFKNFTDWFSLKPQINDILQPPQFSQREVWNCHLGVNIGFEIDGKNQDFIRPVLVLKKLSRDTFIGIPLTTKLKNGNWYYPSRIKNKDGRYIFSQIRTIDSKRLYNRIERIDSVEFQKIKKAFINFMA